jgi:hypothetical protein
LVLVLVFRGGGRGIRRFIRLSIRQPGLKRQLSHASRPELSRLVQDRNTRRRARVVEEFFAQPAHAEHRRNRKSRFMPQLVKPALGDPKEAVASAVDERLPQADRRARTRWPATSPRRTGWRNRGQPAERLKTEHPDAAASLLEGLGEGRLTWIFKRLRAFTRSARSRPCRNT